MTAKQIKDAEVDEAIERLRKLFSDDDNPKPSKANDDQRGVR